MTRKTRRPCRKRLRASLPLSHATVLFGFPLQVSDRLRGLSLSTPPLSERYPTSAYAAHQEDGTIQQFEFASGQLPPPLTMQFLTTRKKGSFVKSEQHNDAEPEKRSDVAIEPIQGQQLPMLRAMDTGEILWGFTQLVITDRGGEVIAVLEPPGDDIVTVCRNHIKTLEALIEECKAVLKI